MGIANRGLHNRYGGGQERITHQVWGRRGSKSRYREWAREEYTAGIGVGRRGSHSRYRGGQERITE